MAISPSACVRPTSFRFYQEGLGLTAVGAGADDGVPEPLRYVLNDGYG